MAIHGRIMQCRATVDVNLVSLDTIFECEVDQTQCTDDGGLMETGPTVDVIHETIVERAASRMEN